MSNFARMLLTVLYYFFVTESYALLIRAILSWIVDENSESVFLVVIGFYTELIIAPIRATVGRAFESSPTPIDISFIMAVIITEIITFGLRFILA